MDKGKMKVSNDMTPSERGVLNPLHSPANLPASFSVWLASPNADAFKGKFLWANWDVEELLALQGEVESKNLLTTGLKGWGYAVA